MRFKVAFIAKYKYGLYKENLFIVLFKLSLSILP